MEATTLGQMALQPQLLAFRQATAPLYGQMDFKMARDMLLGTAGGQQVKNPEYLAKKASLDLYRKTKDRKGRPAADPAEIARLEAELAGMDEFVTTESTRGMLDLYEKDISPTLSRMDALALRSQREADISAVEQLGGRATDALRSADPQQAALVDEMNRQAIEELSLGGALSDAQKRNIQQGMRSGQTARGLGTGVGDAVAEALAQAEGAEQQKASRRQFAGQVAGLNQSVKGDPFMSILGRSSGVSPMMAGQIFGQGKSMVPGQIFNPESNYAGGLYGQNAQMQLGARQATAQNRSNMFGAVMGGLGSLGGGLLSRKKPPPCWVAREVFGESNPEWVVFFMWKEGVGPKWFRTLYNRFGEYAAKFIANKPRLKERIRTWMRSKIYA
tara:strand:+ start:1257 stop:2420 length:1164 start_codon:yes stop_codon:yes gene_type:complete